MLIWDNILKEIESAGHKRRITKEEPCQTLVTVDGEELSIGLKEKTTRKEHVPTPEEIRRSKPYTHLFQPPKWVYVPSGTLTLKIDHDGRNQLNWTDTDKKRIEDRLTSFADVLVEIAKEIKECRARAEEWKRQSTEEERRRHEAARHRAEENRRIEELERQASSWRKACSIRQFVEAVREEAIRRTGGIEPGGPLDLWIQWAERHVNALDPVGSVLAKAIPAETA
jgi:hypothetical protein